MKRDWKYRISKVTGGSRNFDKKIMKMKSSWDEVEGILSSAVNKKKK